VNEEALADWGLLRQKKKSLRFEGIWCLNWQSIEVGQVGKNVREVWRAIGREELV